MSCDTNLTIRVVLDPSKGSSLEDLESIAFHLHEALDFSANIEIRLIARIDLERNSASSGSETERIVDDAHKQFPDSEISLEWSSEDGEEGSRTWPAKKARKKGKG